ncbi:extracellular solute-binding protein [Alkalicoccobacillus gibsonii]|uniref:Extracellular solute-binding protein n=1 Tax=Alkalicoccobacillus gibsonii TaxID=79881 RepID=A0ABU9VDL1_9BACI
MRSLPRILGLFSLVVLASCAPANSDLSSGSNDSSDSDVTISFIHWRGEDKEAFDSLINEFEDANPGISVDMNIYPSDQYQSQAQTLVRDGSTGDVFTSFPGAQFDALNKIGAFADLSDGPFLDHFEDSLIEAGQKDGVQYALPYQLVFNQPVYNVDIFEELGLDIPRDWDSFLEVCQTLLDNGYIPIAFPGADIGPGQLMNSMVMNNAPDEDIFEKLQAGEVKATDEWWVKTLTQFKELEDLGYFQEDSLGTQHPAAISLVAQEKAAMLATGSYAMAGLLEQNEDLNLQLLAPITVDESDATYEGIHTTTFMLGVNSQSEHPEEAKAFIEFLSEKEPASEYANATGQHLTVKELDYETDELRDTADWMDKNTRFQPRFLITNADVEQALISSIQDVIAGTDPEDAAASAQGIIDQHID